MPEAAAGNRNKWRRQQTQTAARNPDEQRDQSCLSWGSPAWQNSWDASWTGPNLAPSRSAPWRTAEQTEYPVLTCSRSGAHLASSGNSRLESSPTRSSHWSAVERGSPLIPEAGGRVDITMMRNDLPYRGAHVPKHAQWRRNVGMCTNTPAAIPCILTNSFERAIDHHP